jgi:adenosine deaminase
MIDRKLPLIDLHRHLEGCIRLQTMLELADEHGLKLPGKTLESLRPQVVLAEKQAGLMEFLDRLQWMIHVLADPAACQRVAYEAIGDAAAEGLDYLELRFSPGFMARPHGLEETAVVEAVIDGARRGEREFGVMTRLIGILSRTFGPEACHRELEALLVHRDKVRALDLAGDEARWPGELFRDHFRKGRDAGWLVTVHAGEAAGAESVRYAIDGLGATRIGHGIRAADDPGLLDLMREREIGMEICLTSNIQTNTVTSLADHPLAAFLDQGLLASINTDDPVISGIDLRHEFCVAAPAAGITAASARLAQLNAFKTAFISPSERAEVIQHVARRTAST